MPEICRNLLLCERRKQKRTPGLYLNLTLPGHKDLVGVKVMSLLRTGGLFERLKFASTAPKSNRLTNSKKQLKCYPASGKMHTDSCIMTIIIWLSKSVVLIMEVRYLLCVGTLDTSNNYQLPTTFCLPGQIYANNTAVICYTLRDDMKMWIKTVQKLHLYWHYR